jgi:hypothetical protein
LGVLAIGLGRIDFWGLAPKSSDTI